MDLSNKGPNPHPATRMVDVRDIVMDAGIPG
jgi:hypothetical protein